MEKVQRKITSTLKDQHKPQKDREFFPMGEELKTHGRFQLRPQHLTDCQCFLMGREDSIRAELKLGGNRHTERGRAQN